MISDSPLPSPLNGAHAGRIARLQERLAAQAQPKTEWWEQRRVEQLGETSIQYSSREALRTAVTKLPPPGRPRLSELRQSESATTNPVVE